MDIKLTLLGEGTDVVTVTAELTIDNVFNVGVDYVNISGFTVTGATGAFGIYLYDVDHCNISGNNVSNSSHGISVGDSSNTLTKNIVPY